MQVLINFLVINLFIQLNDILFLNFHIYKHKTFDTWQACMG